MHQFTVLNIILLALIVLISRDKSILISARECGAIDIRSQVTDFRQLEGCTVIKGFLLISLISEKNMPSNMTQYRFPDLREITEFFMMYHVDGLVGMQMFPNLVVIRGRRLIHSYAFAVTEMAALERIEFGSLIAIQRGHAYIGNSPKLCFLKKINWDRLTLSSGENHIFPENPSCPLSDCLGCDYCWSNRICQKFENSNLLNLARGNFKCHPECLGGCYNSSNTGCYVCKSITDHGACVTKCPPNMYYSEQHQRCYTKEECYENRLYIIGRECVRNCPSGYNQSRKLVECVQCKDCVIQCFPEGWTKDIIISSLGEAEKLAGCQYARGNLVIQMGSKVEEKHLFAPLQSLRKIQGYIKVYYSPFLKTLQFLQNIEIVEGNPLENDTFALVLHNNQNLQELWVPTQGKTVEFVNGGIYSYGNNRLCNKVLHDFGQNVIHNKEKNLIQINDQEVLCDPVNLHVETKSLTHNSVQLSWAKNKTVGEVEIVYREAQFNKGTESELSDEICFRVHWKRDLMFKTEIADQNATHYFYNISNLLPFTYYDYFVKTFEGKNDYSARSPMQRFQTKPDFPTAPRLITHEKFSDKIIFELVPRNKLQERVTHYSLTTFEQSIDSETLNTRDYCHTPFVDYKKSSIEDFDDCCLHKRDQMEDEEFHTNMENEFACALNKPKNCQSNIKQNSKDYDRNLKMITVMGLKHFTRYIFYLYACNDLGCGSFFMHSETTAIKKDFDLVTDVYSCRYNYDRYTVQFNEPQTPNGAILNYFVHFQKTDESVQNSTEKSILTYCINREKLQQKENGLWFHVKDFVPNQISVTVFTTGNKQLSKFFDINDCTKQEPNSVLKIGIISVAVLMLIVLIICLYRCREWIAMQYIYWSRRITQSVRRTFGRWFDEAGTQLDAVEMQTLVEEK